MRIFSLDAEYNVVWEPQVLMLEPFKKIFNRDKSKDKVRANKELAFVWFFVDIKSDYQFHTDPEVRTLAIKADLKLSDSWKVDDIVKEAISFYEKKSSSITASILKDSMYVATALSTKMREAVDADTTMDVTEISKLIDGVKKLPDVIKAIQEAEKAVIREIKEKQEHSGAKEHAMFEDDL